MCVPIQAAADALRRELAVEASTAPFDHQPDAAEASHEPAVVDAPSAGAGAAPRREGESFGVSGLGAQSGCGSPAFPDDWLDGDFVGAMSWREEWSQGSAVRWRVLECIGEYWVSVREPGSLSRANGA